MKISSGPLTRPVPGRKGSLMIRLGVEPEVDMPLPRELELLLKRESLLVLVKGETGMGKTTAALELMARLQGDGDTVHISTRSYPDKLVFQHALFSKLAALPNVHFFTTLEFDPSQFVVAHNVVSGLHRLLSNMESPLVVLDSWEGIADYLPQETRMKVEQSLMAILENTRARMILVSERPQTDTTLDQLADAIIVLHQKVIEDRRVRDLDALLGGGVPRGSTVLLEIRGEVPFEGQIYVPLTALLNFLATNNAVMAFPYSDYDPTRARLFATQFMPEDVYDTNMRVFTTDRVEDPVAIKFSLNPKEDFEKWLDTYSAYKAQGKTIWMLMALDTVENFYGQGVMNFLATVAARAAVNKDIQSILARPNLELTQKVANISQIHLVLTVRWGTLILYGVKPRTGFYGLQFTFDHGYPEFELIPLEDIALTDGERPEVVSVPTSRLRTRDEGARSDMFEVALRHIERSKKKAT